MRGYMTDLECKSLLKDRLLQYRKTLNLPSDVTFGIELEYENIVTDTMSYLLLEEKEYEGVLVGWINKHEADIAEYNKLSEEVNGEINSPILKDNIQTWRDLRNICALLRRNDAVVTERCGGHINIGAHILGENSEYWRNFLLLWFQYRKEISKFSSGEFKIIRPDINCLFQRLSDELNIKNILNVNSALYLCNLGNALFDKWHEVYIRRYISEKIEKNNVIEFRLPNSSLNERIWQNNINFFAKLVLAATKELDVEKTLYNIENNHHSALELANYVFDDEVDKENFLIQTLKTNKEYKKELPSHIIY